jgi:hypothetical protein
MLTQSSGFEELPVTPDWALSVWAANLLALFGQVSPLRRLSMLNG